MRRGPRSRPSRCRRTRRRRSPSTVLDERAEAEAEREQVDRRLDRRRERRRAPVRREVDDLADEHAGDRRALEAADPGACGLARRHHAISSPVSRTKTSSRFAGRRSPSKPRAVAAVDAEDRDARARCGACAAPRRRPRPRPRPAARAARRPRAPRARRAPRRARPAARRRRPWPCDMISTVSASRSASSM